MSLTDFKPLAENPNKHSEYGLKALDDSIQQNGFVTPMTAAADGTILDGNARLERCAEILPADPIVIESDGQRPIVVIRKDIPNSETPEAKRIILASNRVFELDYRPDHEVLIRVAQELDSSNQLKGSGFTKQDIEEIINFKEVDENTGKNMELCNCPICGNEHAKTN